MIAKGNQLFQYIPQRPPIVMIDFLEYASTTEIISGLHVEDGNLFIKDDHLREPGLVENIAQTIAAGAGYNQVLQGKPVNLGFIAAIRDLKINRLPKIGQDIRTTVNIVNEVLDVTIVKGRITSCEEIIAECEMRIYIQNN